MSDTFCTVIIPASEQATAHETYPVYFMVGLSSDGKAPATHYVSSGAFSRTEINDMVTRYDQGWRCDFTRELSDALDTAGLKMIVPPIAIQN